VSLGDELELLVAEREQLYPAEIDYDHRSDLQLEERYVTGCAPLASYHC
jgi:hypothetical protein